jgi:two-component system response regulator MprA
MAKLPSPDNRAKRVLLVDGDARTSRRLAELLAEDGYDVELAADGAEALARLALTPAPDALITELSLRVGDGASVARSARARCPALRVVVLTRYVNSVVPASFGTPLPVILPKPLEYERLLSVLGAPGDGDALLALRAFPKI